MIPLYSKETRENKISHSLLSKAIKGESPEIVQREKVARDLY
jgi:hypothetical protein